MLNSAKATIELTIDVFPRITRYPIDFSLPETQIRMVRNQPKYRAFSEVMAQCVRGKRVLEIGTGSGVLALLAVAQGAARIVAVDREQILPMTRAVLKHYRQSKQIELVEGDVFDLDGSLGTFDVILSETIGYLGFEENIVPILSYARQHFGIPRTIVMPSHMAVTLEPLQLEAKSPHLAGSQHPSQPFERIGVSKPVKLGVESESALEIVETWRATHETRISAVAVYFGSTLFAQTRITNRENPDWPHCVIPLQNHIEVCTGEIVDCRMKLVASGQENYRAEIQVQDAAGLCGSMSSFETPEICIESLPPVANTLDALCNEVETTLQALNLSSRLV